MFFSADELIFGLWTPGHYSWKLDQKDLNWIFNDNDGKVTVLHSFEEIDSMTHGMSFIYSTMQNIFVFDIFPLYMIDGLIN